MKNWLFLLLLTCFGCDAISQRYQLELIVFAHPNAAGLSSEQWPDITPDTSTNTDSPAFMTQNATDFILNREANDIAAQKNYTVLYHQAFAIDTAALDHPQTLPINATQNDMQLNGALNLSLDKYFDVHLKLYLSMPLTNALWITRDITYKTKQKTIIFLLDQNRRMRSNELNYFEHPVFGALIKIIPINQPQSGADV